MQRISKNDRLRALLLSMAVFGALGASAQMETTNPIPTLKIQADQVNATVSPMLYGLMTEEINYSYEGGLYGQLIRNCTFKANPTNAVYWTATGGATLSLDTNQPLNDALNVSLKMETSPAGGSPAGVVNGGYWGIPVRPNTTCRLSFYARAAGGFDGSLSAALVSNDGQQQWGSVTVGPITAEWKKYEATFTTKDVPISADNSLTITTTSGGTVWLDLVSLFGPTFNDRENGNRPDLMQTLAAMHPAFLRFPGGNYLEGRTIASRFDWKKTIGPLAQRPGHESPWGYWSTDGMGLLEFLEWCEDLHMQPLLAVYAGYSLDHEYVKPGPDLQPFVQDALDEIEYVTGDTNTTWGAQRARDGHPDPFPLQYIEVGNEDWFDRSGSYGGRFKQFYDAVKARYSKIQLIATAPVKSCTPDLIDEHYYRSLEQMEAGAHQYDSRPRTGLKVFVGEWATREGAPTPNMAGALGDAAWMTGLERNSDLVLMASYAPLFVNVSELKKGGSMQWRCNLIGYSALTCYGSPSYYAQVMFSALHGDEILATSSENIPTRMWQPPARTRNGVKQPLQPMQQLDQVFFDATRNRQDGTIYLKLVNCLGVAQPVKIQISGAPVGSTGRATVLKAEHLEDTNSIQSPKNIVPVTETIENAGSDFIRTLPPYSISVLELETPQ